LSKDPSMNVINEWDRLEEWDMSYVQWLP